MSPPLHTILPTIICMSLLLFLLRHSHLLMTLLTIETIILSLLLFLLLTHANGPQNNQFFLLLLLTLAACEASLGLALLVSMSRSFGSDHSAALSVNKC